MVVVRLYARTLLFGLRWIMGVHVELRGREHIPDGPLLVAGKRQSMLDVFIPFLMFDDPSIVMKQELLWYPGLGWYARRTGMIPIDRDGSTRTLKAMLQVAAKRVEDGRQVVIFPEGTRTKPGTDAEYHTAGPAALYRALNLPLLPVATNSGLCWKARGITRRPGKVVYEVLPALPADGNRKDIIVRMEAEIEAASSLLLDEGLAAQGRTRTDLIK